jgi:hypothetical protein
MEASMGRTLFGFDIDDYWQYENGFFLVAPPSRLGKALAHYELYKRVIALPGCIVECGVFKGVSLMQFATLRRLLENDDSRKIVGFDAFGPFPGVHEAADAAFVEQWERRAGPGIPVNTLAAALDHKEFRNVELIAGDVLDTLPRYIGQHPELKIALLHVDVDVYLPTRVTLESLYDRVLPGGIVILDDYPTVAGATRAVDEFLAGRNVTIQKLPLAHIPSYFVKP